MAPRQHRKKPKILAVFDFDSTLVESDRSHFHIPVKSEYKTPGVTSWQYPVKTLWDMPPIYKAMQSRNVLATDLLRCLDEMNLILGMGDLLLDLSRKGHEVIIISDCNSIFIGNTLKKAGLEKCVTEIYTNAAWFDGSGRLRVCQFHNQDWCGLCSPNLCKGHVLYNYLQKRHEEGEDFLFVAYIGDGYNDMCPCLCLNPQDMVFPRIGFELIQSIEIANGNKNKSNAKVVAKVVPWENGFSIKKAIFNEIKHLKGQSWK